MQLLEANRRTVRATPNPLDKATIVSIYPKDIDERKHTLIPGRWFIPAGTYDKPSVVVVGPSSWWKDVGEEQPLLEIPVSAIQIAESIINDYSNGRLECNMDDCKPGLFFIPGEIEATVIKLGYKKLLDSAKAKQDNWYQALVRMADSFWARSQGNPLAVGDDMRLAAQELGLKDKPWMQDFNTLQLNNCPACGALRNSNFPMCQNCKVVIDVKRFEELGLKFAV